MRLFMLGIIALALMGCGPEQTAREAEKQETDAITKAQKVYLTQVQGNYAGFVTTLDGKKRLPANLILRTFSSFVPVPGRLEIVEIPNMVGFLEISPNESNIRNGFNTGTYDPDERVLKMIGSRDDSTVSVFLEVKVEGDRLIGELFRGPLAQPVEFTRTRR